MNIPGKGALRHKGQIGPDSGGYFLLEGKKKAMGISWFFSKKAISPEKTDMPSGRFVPCTFPS